MRWPLHNLTLFGFLFPTLIINPNIDLKFAIVFISWFLLAIGLTLFNDYYDKDTKPVAGLDNPPPITLWVLVTGLVFMGLSLFLSFYVNFQYLIVISTVAVITTLYSHPSVRIKKYASGAVIVNGIVGGASFLAVVVLKHTTLEAVLGTLTQAIALASVYLLTQMHQSKEDKKRGDTSVVSIFGKKVTAVMAIILLILTGVLGSVLLIISQSIIVFLTILGYYLICMLFAFVWLRKIDLVSHIKVMKIMLQRVFLGANLLLIIILILKYGYLIDL